MNKTTAYGTIKNGKLTIDNRKRFEQDCREFKDCDIELILKKRGKRSTAQNSYYWGVVVQEVRLGLIEIGYKMTADEVHHFLKQKFNAVQIANKNGEAIEVPGSTTDMNTIEFMEYVASVQQFAAEYLSITIPDPNQALSLQM